MDDAHSEKTALTISRWTLKTLSHPRLLVSSSSSMSHRGRSSLLRDTEARSEGGVDVPDLSFSDFVNFLRSVKL